MATAPAERRAPIRERPKPSKPAFLSSSSRFQEPNAFSRRPCSRNLPKREANRPAAPPRPSAARLRSTENSQVGNSCSPHPPLPGRYRSSSSSASSSFLSSSSSSSTSSPRAGTRPQRSTPAPAPHSAPRRVRVSPPPRTRVPFHGRRLNLEQIAEMLLALDRIEQDEEITQEQLMALEANLLLAGISFRDRHRDMRLDIDDMSYEELLALEEEMGVVSTALPEEALARCLQRKTHGAFSASAGALDDLKCSICQEEYVKDEEVGKLLCSHVYHLSCIQQWLRLKNWCPICKASACPS